VVTAGAKNHPKIIGYLYRRPLHLRPQLAADQYSANSRVSAVIQLFFRVFEKQPVKTQNFPDNPTICGERITKSFWIAGTWPPPIERMEICS
jgi:hypothetical protein